LELLKVILCEHFSLPLHNEFEQMMADSSSEKEEVRDVEHLVHDVKLVLVHVHTINVLFQRVA